MFTPRWLLAVALVAALHTPTEVADWLDAHVDAVEAYPRHATDLAESRADFEARHRIVAADWSPCVPAVPDRFDPECRVWSVEYAAPPTTTTVAPASTSATETSAPPPSGDTSMGSGVERWRGLVAEFWPSGSIDRVLRIMACESGGDPSARNPSGASGLMQVMPFWADHFGISRDALFDPATNLDIARRIYEQQGWGAWVCRG